jgi:hypothetical protein
MIEAISLLVVPKQGPKVSSSDQWSHVHLFYKENMYFKYVDTNNLKIKIYNRVGCLIS